MMRNKGRLLLACYLLGMVYVEECLGQAKPSSSFADRFRLALKNDSDLGLMGLLNQPPVLTKVGSQTNALNEDPSSDNESANPSGTPSLSESPSNPGTSNSESLSDSAEPGFISAQNPNSGSSDSSSSQNGASVTSDVSSLLNSSPGSSGASSSQTSDSGTSDTSSSQTSDSGTSGASSSQTSDSSSSNSETTSSQTSGTGTSGASSLVTSDSGTPDTSSSQTSDSGTSSSQNSGVSSSQGNIQGSENNPETPIESSDEESPAPSTVSTSQFDFTNLNGHSLNTRVRFSYLSDGSVEMYCRVFTTEESLFEGSSEEKPKIYLAPETSQCSSIASLESIKVKPLATIEKSVEEGSEIFKEDQDLPNEIETGCIFVASKAQNLQGVSSSDSADDAIITSLDDDDNKKETSKPNKIKEDPKESIMKERRRSGRLIFHNNVQTRTLFTLNPSSLNLLAFGSKTITVVPPSLPPLIPFVPAPVVATPFDPMGTFPNIQLPSSVVTIFAVLAVALIAIYIASFFGLSLFSGGIFNPFRRRNSFDNADSKSVLDKMTDFAYSAFDKSEELYYNYYEDDSDYVNYDYYAENEDSKHH